MLFPPSTLNTYQYIYIYVYVSYWFCFSEQSQEQRGKTHSFFFFFVYILMYAERERERVEGVETFVLFPREHWQYFLFSKCHIVSLFLSLPMFYLLFAFPFVLVVPIQPSKLISSQNPLLICRSQFFQVSCFHRTLCMPLLNLSANMNSLIAQRVGTCYLQCPAKA